MKIALVGVSHHNTPVVLREKLAFAPDEVAVRLLELINLPHVAEALILSTCNRVEIYLATHQPEAACAEVSLWLAQLRHLSLETIQPHLYTQGEAGAARHGFRVASSLESLVLGEAQILGQMKQAYQIAVAQGVTGPILNKYFHHAFRVAKRVRTETAIAENAVSIAFAAVALARRIFGDLSGGTCLLVGAGEMCELAARHMVGNGISRVLVTNRTLERAESLAAQFDGSAFPLEDLPRRLHEADIVLSSTGASHHLITRAMVAEALPRRRRKPMFFIDIAVPRDIDPTIAGLSDAFLYDIDDLSQIVEQNRRERDQAAARAGEIIDQEVPGFQAWLDSLEVVPTIIALRERLEALRATEVAKALRGWPGLTDDERRRVEWLATRLVNKILHPPIARLKQLAVQEDGDQYVDTVRQIFGLNTPPEPGS
ncbi:MAG: glutamyl-tRNA reductase [Magnetococcus sp. WYHC-3]